MKTQLVITITHSDALSADNIIEHAIRPFINEVNSDSEYDWTFAVASTQTTDELRDKSLRSALLLVLSDFSEHMENDWIIDGILNDDERIVVWEPFENWDRDVLVKYIEETADTIYHTYFL